MRLLFDEQLSEALVRKLGDVFPGALHVRLLNRGGAPDPDVWELAREHRCVLVTKDGDFHRLIARLLTVHAEDIQKFEAQSDATVLELG